MLQSRAVENGVFVASCNRSELEELDGVPMDNFGRSVIPAPDGTTVAAAPPGAGALAVSATLDLTDVERQRETLPLLKYYRSDLYGSPLSWK
jgi:predicted amidohydrolase